MKSSEKKDVIRFLRGMADTLEENCEYRGSKRGAYKAGADSAWGYLCDGGKGALTLVDYINVNMSDYTGEDIITYI